MANKKSSSVRTAVQSKSQLTRTPVRAAKSSFQKATDAVSGVAGGIPSGAIFWGLGALALGAAAFGAYTYRDKIVELYEGALESFAGEESGDGADTSPSSQVRKSKSSGTSSQIEQH